VESYKPKFYYFECVECARRLLLSSVVGIVSANSAANPALGLLICLCFNWVFIELKPFNEPSDCSLGVVLAYSLTLFFFAALLIKVDATSDDADDQYVFGVILIAVLVMGPVLLFGLNAFPLLKRACIAETPGQKRQTLEEIELGYVNKKLEANDDEHEREVNEGRSDKDEENDGGVLNEAECFDPIPSFFLTLMAEEEEEEEAEEEAGRISSLAVEEEKKNQTGANGSVEEGSHRPSSAKASAWVAEGLEWLRKAAAQGSSEAQSLLAENDISRAVVPTQTTSGTKPEGFCKNNLRKGKGKVVKTKRVKKKKK